MTDAKGYCPKCGKFCREIVGTLSERGLEAVWGICKVHGEVDLSKQPYDYDDFMGEEDYD